MAVWKRFVGQWLASVAVAVPFTWVPGERYWVLGVVTAGLLLHARWAEAPTGTDVETGCDCGNGRSA
ncbi:hypothetical protein LO762_09830 [Actinocorallia sp. API 0066]|uniref:hypothetical protein n=1 Tax=Actinocorallia sp. API 0066 TaxID=2896846 RepID=UPI001E3EDEDE|nr:hypothetical protein [Actinocorallia sp. API 0066]MCD0449488.1 hypothetical protein [Actinocorallia sp. API 0066]